MALKIGDKVIVKDKMLEGEIIAIGGLIYPYSVYVSGEIKRFEESELELVEEVKRMVQETHDYEEGKWYPWSGGKCPLHPKDEYIVWCFTSDKWIGEMYSYHYASPNTWTHSKGYKKVVYFKITKKYVPPVTKEMTVEEISKALGYDVKIVKG